MFLKSLKIEKDTSLIRDIHFKKGINLIIDETKSIDIKESGNNVGKTTVLRLIYFCLGGNGHNIYRDTEFKNKSNTQVEDFLKNNNVIITLVLVKSWGIQEPQEIVIRRNFLSYGNKIQEINGEKIKNTDFSIKLKELIFGSPAQKPTLKQIIARNIRDEKNRLANTIKVLHPTTRQEEYEALYLFWLGVRFEDTNKKQQLFAEKKTEESLQKRLRKEGSLSQIDQSLLIINRIISGLEEKRGKFNLNEEYEQDLISLNQIKSNINRISTSLSRLELRKELILESKGDLEKEFSSIDTQLIKNLYEEANVLIPNIQKSFEETLTFHNKMVEEKLNYITQDLPKIESEISSLQSDLNELLLQEKTVSEKLSKSGTFEEMQSVITELNKAYEKKGNFEEQRRFWSESTEKLVSIEKELTLINEGINSQDALIQARIAEFNKHFSNISNQLYGEQFVLSSDKNSKGYELNISSLSGNLGTGKKKGQIAAFDLAYIQFADLLGIKCLHFIMHDQIENVHDNQISSLLTDVVGQINCQYVLPVLRDKLPKDIDVRQFEIVSLAHDDKLFRLP